MLMEFRLTFKVIVGAFVEGLRGARQTGDWIGQERGVTSFPGLLSYPWIILLQFRNSWKPVYELF